MEKEGIILSFKEEPNSISGILTAYIKKNPGADGTDEDKKNLIDSILTNAGISPDIWKVTKMKFTPNAWGVTMKQKKSKKGKSETWAEQATNYQLKVEIYVERIVPEKEEFSLTKLIETMPTFQFSHYKPKFNIDGEICLETAVLDAHVGKLAWLYETSYRNYDTNIALEDYKYALDQHLIWANPFKPTIIEYILGQDFFHVDNMSSHTTGGEHTLDVDGRLTKITSKAVEIVLKNIYECRKMAPVKVRWIPGNHDFYASFALAYIIKEHFRKDKFVTVDLGDSSRKATLWGNLLVGWTHRIVGKHNTWGNELAQMFPELWGKSKFREWHHGDQHKKQDVKLVPTFTSGGVLCRQLTALSPVDKWHFENVFTDAIPGGEAFLWSKDVGIFANFISWTGQYEEHRNKLIKGIKQTSQPNATIK